jgi:hyperosmotically inducible periplasmic protein
MKTNVLLIISAALLAMASAGASYAQSGNASPNNAMASPTTSAPMSSAKADRALARSVRRALDKAPGFNVSGVFVKARSGAVTLSGTVDDGDQIRQAEDVARSVQGVTSVSNRLSLFHGSH